jgi:hypothetical protein
MQQQTLQEDEKLDTAQIIQQLRSKDSAIREAAERKLVDQKTDGLHLVLDIIKQEERKRKRRSAWSNILFNTAILPFVIGLFAIRSISSPDYS